eukprot:gene27885-27748_t
MDARKASTAIDTELTDMRDLIAKRGEEEQGSVAALTANLVEMKSIPDPEDIAGVAEHEFYRSELQTKYNEIETLLLEKFARDVATLQKKHTDTCAAFGIDVEAEAAASGSKQKTTLAADGDLDDDGDAIVVDAQEQDEADPVADCKGGGKAMETDATAGAGAGASTSTFAATTASAITISATAMDADEGVVGSVSHSFHIARDSMSSVRSITTINSSRTSLPGPDFVSLGAGAGAGTDAAADH